MADPTVVAAAIDYTPMIIAIGTAITVVVAAIVNGWIAIGAARDAREAKKEAEAARLVMIETKKDVDGKMTEMSKLIREEALSAGRQEERDAQIARQGVADAATLAEKNKAPVVTPAAQAETLTPTKDPVVLPKESK